MTWDDLAHDPARAGPGPHSHQGRLHSDRHSPPDPVTWHTLARYGVACRGPAPTDLEIWADPQVLAAWTLGNLDSYWRRLLDRAGRLPSRWGVAALTPYVAVWVVTGVPRLHYTLATGDVTSKEGAGGHALQRFAPQWHRVVHEALRIRRADRAGSGVASAIGAQLSENLRLRDRDQGRSLYGTPFGRRRDVLAFGDMVIGDAHRCYGVASRG